MPAPYAITDFVNAVPNVLRDDANKLYPGQGADTTIDDVLSPLVARALDRYSKDKPLEIVSDVASDGTQLLELPSYPDALAGQEVPVFDPLFSTIRAIEFPIAQNPPEYVDPNDFRLYRDPSGTKVMLTADTPNAGNACRFTWTARHASDGSTVPDGDFNAVVDFTAALAAEQLATIYAQTSDPTMSADVVNYRSKSQEYQSLAKMLRKRYYNHIGVDESATGEADQRPAIAIGQQYLEMQSGVERLIHSRYSR